MLTERHSRLPARSACFFRVSRFAARMEAADRGFPQTKQSVRLSSFAEEQYSHTQLKIHPPHHDGIASNAACASALPPFAACLK